MHLFINDIVDVVFGLQVKMKLFADDVKLYSILNLNGPTDLFRACDLITGWA